MIVTLSDYILEQEVSTASCDDITMEQLQAETEVYASLAKAYAKQYLMLEYASEYTMEADDETATATEEKKPGKFKQFWINIWKAIKAAFTWLKEKILKFGNWIKSKFSKKAADKAEAVAENGTDEEVAELADAIVADYNAATGAKMDGTVDSGRTTTVKYSALDLAVAYDTEGLEAIFSEMEKTAKELLESFQQLLRDEKDYRSTTPGTDERGKRVAWLEETVGKDVQKFSDAIDQLEVKMKSGGRETGGSDNKRKLLSGMSKFTRWMQSTGADQLKRVEEYLNRFNAYEVGADEEGLKMLNPDNAGLMTQQLIKIQETAVKAAHKLGDILYSTQNLAASIQKETAKYEQGVRDENGRTKSSNLTPEQQAYKDRLKSEKSKK